MAMHGNLLGQGFFVLRCVCRRVTVMDLCSECSQEFGTEAPSRRTSRILALHFGTAQPDLLGPVAEHMFQAPDIVSHAVCSASACIRTASGSAV